MSYEETERRVLEAVGANLDRTIQTIQAAIRIPGVSKTGENLHEMAAWLSDFMQGVGATLEVHEGQTAPIIEAEFTGNTSHDSESRQRHKLLFYTLYDVQPANPEEWSSPPFAAEIVDDKNGPRLIGRGAFNSKGPLIGFLCVLRLFRELGIELPVDVVCIIEGEEEIGSPSLKPFLTANKRRLSECDGVLIPYLGTTSGGDTPLRLGFKGLAFLEFTITGGQWGGPARHDVHAMHGAWLGSPGWELLTALTTLQDRQGRLTIDSLSVPDWWTEDDSELVRRAAKQSDPVSILEDLGAKAFAWPGDLAQQFERLLRNPTLNLDGIWVGSTPHDAMPATQVPRTARAVMDMRFTPGMDPDEAIAAIRSHLDARGFFHVAVKATDAYPASRCNRDQPVVAALVEACKSHTDRLVLLPIHAGAAPLCMFSELIGVPYVFGGLGHGGRPHAPDEYLDVESMKDFMKTMVSFLFRFAERQTC